MRYALVKNGVIENCIEWDGSPNWSPETSALAVPAPDGFGPGDSYDAATLQFSKGPVASPAPDIPGFISAVKAALGGVEGIASIPQSSMFYFALQQEEWADVKSLLQHAVATGSVSPAQVTAILGIAVQYHIPIPA